MRRGCLDDTGQGGGGKVVKGMDELKDAPVGPLTSPPRRPPIPPKSENCAPLERRELAKARKVGAWVMVARGAVGRPYKQTVTDGH